MEIVDTKAAELEDHFKADVMYYSGEIHPTYEKHFRNFVEHLKGQKKSKKAIAIVLNTNGGSVEIVERMVDVVRHHYRQIFVIVPDQAMSAGTIFCMAADKIYMDYSSALGPIDPQVLVRSQDGEYQYVPALGYLDQVEKMIEKSANGTLTPAEFALLQNQDLALLRRYEQARELSIALLKKWLVKYKFKDWKVHRTNAEKKGQKVTKSEKEERAEEIARKLGDNNHWHSHGRKIGLNVLRDELRLEIDDYTNDIKLREMIRVYNDLLTDYGARMQRSFFMHAVS
jgi:membrane-bound ClpP family serine protease